MQFLSFYLRMMTFSIYYSDNLILFIQLEELYISLRRAAENQCKRDINFLTANKDLRRIIQSKTLKLARAWQRSVYIWNLQTISEQMV